VDCDNALNLIGARLDREMRPEEGPGLEAHLAQCPDCRAAADAFALQDAELRRAFAPRREAAVRVAERVVAQLPAARRNGRGRFQWLPILLSAAAGFLLAVGIFRPWQRRPNEVVVSTPPSTPAAPKPTVLLALTTGAVEALLPGQDAWQPLLGGSRVEVGARVRTAPDGRCEFRTADGSEVRLNGGTELGFQTERRLDLAAGQILASVIPGQVPFEVKVAQASITAVGTQFDVLCRPADTMLTVLQGSTRVADTTVQAGEVARIVGGRVAEKREHLIAELDLQTRWVHEILKLKGYSCPELTKRVDDIFAQIGQSKTNYMDESEIRSLGCQCVLPLTRFIQSDRSRTPEQQAKRVEAARIVADLAEPWSVPDFIDLLADDDPDVRYYAAKGLDRLTGHTEGFEAEDWRKQPAAARARIVKEWQGWWQKNKDRYPSPP
jgi:hypothetical protein